MTAKYRSIPPVANDVPSLSAAVEALRERAEVQARERGRLENSFVSIQDLIDLGLITAVEAQRLR